LTSDIGLGALGAMWAPGPWAEVCSDEAWLRAMLEVESALAEASSAAGLIPDGHAGRIRDVANAIRLDLRTIAREATATGTPVVPLVERLRSGVGPEVAPSVHRGATSQDIVDSATMVTAARAVDRILDELGGASDAAAELARAYRDTPIAGRTLLQQAVPTTFGLKAATWMTGLDRAARSLGAVRSTGLAVQLGGAAGTLAAFDGRGQQVAADLAARLGLAAPVIPWHAERTRIGDLAAALGVTAGSVAKPARDIVLLAQTEVGEVEEGTVGRGASSSMPHKHNPIAAVSATACAIRSVGLVTTLLSAMAQEHERAAGSWHAEWLPLRELLATVGAGVAWLQDSLHHLVIHPDALARNLGNPAHPDIGEAASLVEAALAEHASRPRR
jgi:3-carboxy-cis,cis-muconate cycloisomerase